MNSQPAQPTHPLEAMEGMQRRRFLGLAAFASASVVGVGVGVGSSVAAPTVAHAAECIDQLSPPYSGGGGRWNDAARKAYIALHHVGGAGTQFKDPCPYAAPHTGCDSDEGRHINKYDFAVNGDGKIAVGGRYTNPAGCHARTCNCQATGIVMLGCFGGCGGAGDVATAAQKCGVGYVWRQTGIERRADKLKPHRYCDVENPCNGQQVGGPCPGERYVSYNAGNDYWSSAGLSLRSDILRYANGGTC